MEIKGDQFLNIQDLDILFKFLLWIRSTTLQLTKFNTYYKMIGNFYRHRVS